MLKAGQTLWWIDYNTEKEGTVTVHDVEETRFSVLYKGKIYYRPYSAIGTKLFYTSQLSSRESITKTKSCANCFFRHSGECSSLQNILCADYRFKQIISKDEQNNWPTHGDATTFRTKKRKPIKKEKW